MSQPPDSSAAPATTTSTPTPAAPAPPPRRRRTCLRWGCISIAAILAVMLVAVISYRQLRLGNLTPEQISLARQAETEILILPNEWHQPATLPSSDLLAFWDEFIEQTSTTLMHHRTLVYGPADGSSTESLFNQIGDGGPPVHDDQRASYTQLLADLQPIIERTSASTALPGFTMETSMYMVSPVDRLIVLQNFTKMMGIAARDEAAHGNYANAVEFAALPLKLIKRSEQALAIDNLIASAVIAISSNAMDTIAKQCNDTTVLALGSELLQQLRPSVFPGDLSLWKYGDIIGPIRYAAAIGYPVNIKPQTLASYFRQAGKVRSRDYFQWVVANLPLGDRRVAIAKMWLKPSTETCSGPGCEPQSLAQRMCNFDYATENSTAYTLASIVLGIDPWAVHYVSNLGLYGQAETTSRIRVVMSWYDLTQMHFARRITELKGEPPPAALPDPFTSGTLQFSKKRNAYFSVGPDKVDQKAALQYDATNGTVSPGDVLVGGER